MQHIENLFRRCKGQLVTVQTLSGVVYTGTIIEVTDDYLALTEPGGSEVFLFFQALESMTKTEDTAEQ